MRSDAYAAYLSLRYHDQRIKSIEDVWKVKLIVDKPVTLDECSPDGSVVHIQSLKTKSNTWNAIVIVLLDAVASVNRRHLEHNSNTTDVVECIDIPLF